MLTWMGLIMWYMAMLYYKIQHEVWCSGAIHTGYKFIKLLDSKFNYLVVLQSTYYTSMITTKHLFIRQTRWGSRKMIRHNVTWTGVLNPFQLNQTDHDLLAWLFACSFVSIFTNRWTNFQPQSQIHTWSVRHILFWDLYEQFVLWVCRSWTLW